MQTAVIKDGGKQYVVGEGSVISIEARSDKEYKEGDSIEFGEILLTDDGSKATVGTPVVSGVKATGTVLAAGLGKKIEVNKYKNKTRQFKKKGHRQPFLKVKVEKIG